MLKSSRVIFGLILAGAAVTIIVSDTNAQTPASASGVTLKANLADPAHSSDVKIDIVRWSTDREREAIVTSLSPPVPGRGAPAESPDVTDPFGAFRGGQNAAAGAAQGGGAAGGRGGRGGRGGGRGGRGAEGSEPPPFDPVVSLGTAIANAPTLGYLWTSESSGYSIKYAFRGTLPDGSERIIIATNRPFAFMSSPPSTSKPEFMVLELRMNPKSAGEGKAAINTKVLADSESKTIALENYASVPAVLRNVKR